MLDCCVKGDEASRRRYETVSAGTRCKQTESETPVAGYTAVCALLGLYNVHSVRVCGRAGESSCLRILTTESNTARYGANGAFL